MRLIAPSFTFPTAMFGLVLGATSGGVGYGAPQRADGITTYNLIMQPNGAVSV